MDLSGDELAGIVDLFGALSRPELRTALAELAFRWHEDVDDVVLDALVDDAVDRFYLLPVDDRIVAGPAAFPTLPDGAEDLPHILDVPHRSPDTDELGRVAGDRFADEVADAIEAGDTERARELLDLSYDVEAWAPVELADERSRLDGLTS